MSLAEMKEVGFIDDFVWLGNYTLISKKCMLSRDDRFALLSKNFWALMALCLVSVVHTTLEYFGYTRIFDASYAVSVALYVVLLASIWLFDEKKFDRCLKVRLSVAEQAEPRRVAVCAGLLVCCLGLNVGMWFLYDAVVGLTWPDAEVWKECMVRGAVGGSMVMLLKSLYDLYVASDDEWSVYLKTLNGMMNMMVYNVMYILIKRKVYTENDDCALCLRRETRFYLYGYMIVVFGARSLGQLAVLGFLRLRQVCNIKKGRYACSSIRGSKLPIVEYIELDLCREQGDQAGSLRWAILNTCYAVCSSHVTSSMVFACLFCTLIDLFCYDAGLRLVHKSSFDGHYIHIRKYIHLYLTCLVMSIGCVFMYDDMQDSVYYYLYLLLIFVCVLIMRRYLLEDRPAAVPPEQTVAETSQSGLAPREAAGDQEESQALLEHERPKTRSPPKRPTSAEENNTATAETPRREARVKEVTDKFMEDMLEERKRYERLLIKYNQRIEIGALKDRDGRVLFELIEGHIVARRLRKMAQLVPRVVCEASDDKLSDYYYPQFDVYLSHDEWLDYAVKHEIDGLDKLVLPQDHSSLEQGVDFADFMVAKNDAEYRKVFDVYIKKHKLKALMEDYTRKRGEAWLREKRSELTVWIKLERSDMSVENTDKIFDCLTLMYDKFTTYEIGAEEVAQLVGGLMRPHRDEQLLMANRMYYSKWSKPRGIDKPDFCQMVRMISSNNVERQLMTLLGLADLEDSGTVQLSALKGIIALSGVKDLMQKKTVEGVLGDVFGAEDCLPTKELFSRCLESEDMKSICSTLFK